MAITWNIDEARATIRAQMAEANRLDVVIDELASERDAANAEVAHLRSLYTHEHDIAQEQLARALAAEAEAERLRAALKLAVQFVAKAHADGAYNNTVMSGDRALAKINAALYGDSDQDAR